MLDIFFNDLYYLFKERYEEKKDNLNKDDMKKFDYTNLVLLIIISMSLRKTRKKLIKILTKKNHLKT